MTDACIITGKTDCRDRDCELHYMDAPLRLKPERMPVAGAAAFAAYVACIPAANWLVTHLAPVSVGFGQMAPAGVLVAGLAFTARDLLQRTIGKRAALAAIVLGVLLSLALADPRLALASAAAFGVSELLDMAVFTPLERRTFAGAVLASNAAGIVADSVVFLWLAFGSLAFLPGQIIGKAWMTLLALAVIVPLRAWHRAA